MADVRDSGRDHHRHHHHHRDRDDDRHRADKVKKPDDRHRHRHREDDYDDHRRRLRGHDRDGDPDVDGSPEREGSRERRPSRRKEREGSREGAREGPAEGERRGSSKRKERGESEDRHERKGEEKRSRFLEEGREEKRRSREEREKEKGERKSGSRKNRSGERMKSPAMFLEGEETMVVVDDSAEDARLGLGAGGRGSFANGYAMEPLNRASNVVPENNAHASNYPLPTKVSSISSNNENKGVSVTRSHEVPGKSSITDGTSPSSAAGKTGNLSLDALAKAKKALQMQKELSEKLKKIPLLNKSSSSSSDGNAQVSKEGLKVSSSLPTSSSTLPVGAAASEKPPANSADPLAGFANIPNLEAVKRAQALAAKMGFRQDPEFGPLINLFPGRPSPELATQQKPSKVPVLRLDALGREVDEHGNVINAAKPTNLSTLKVNINKQKKEAFQILKPDLDVDAEENPHFDPSMGVNKTKLLRPKRMSFQFVEEGRWSKQAEIVRFKSQFGEAHAKELKTKQAQLAKAKAELADINPNLIEVSERVIPKEKPKDPIPEIEWWDFPLLPSGAYPSLAESATEDALKMEKITIYVEHPLPIEPPAEPAPPPPQPLKLTKKEQKKLRTQRRLAKEKDRQEMIRQGLLEPPKAKIKMSNLMKVLGSEATQDPTRLEMEIRTAAAEREQAHADRNIARKLTPAERREKKERKLFDDSKTIETLVSVYKINDLSHPQTRFKVDVNAQENRLTGCAVISDGISVVIVEGGSKSIKRYSKLMLKRINWAAAVNNEDDEEEKEEGTPVNKCMLVWQGSVAKSSFNRFLVHQCRTEAAARKVFSDAGVGHYWDLAINFTEET